MSISIISTKIVFVRLHITIPLPFTLTDKFRRRIWEKSSARLKKNRLYFQGGERWLGRDAIFEAGPEVPVIAGKWPESRCALMAWKWYRPSTIDVSYFNLSTDENNNDLRYPTSWQPLLEVQRGAVRQHRGDIEKSKWRLFLKWLDEWATKF